MKQVLKDDEADIRLRIESLAKALNDMDLDGVMSVYAPDIVSYDGGPQLQAVGVNAKKKNWEEAFALFQAPIDYEIRDLSITSSDDMAFVRGFARLRGTMKNGNSTNGVWVRVTLCFRKIDSNWLIVHDHVSVPIDFKNGKAVIDLEP